MGYYDFPHTRNYDTDLGYLIKRYFELNTDFESLEKNFDELKAWCIAQLNSEALKTLIANKLDEWLQDGTLASLINDPLLHLTTYDTVVEMLTHSGLESGSKIYCAGADTVNDGKGGHFRIRARLSTDVIDNYNLYLIDGGIKVAERLKDITEKTRKILFIGDSYDNMSDTDSWVKDVAAILNVDYVRRTQGGYGFYRDGTLTWQNLLINNPVEDSNSVTEVVICGGANDVGVEAETLRNAMINLNTYIKNTFINVKYISLGFISSAGGWSGNTLNFFKTRNTYYNVANELGWKILHGVEYPLHNPKYMMDDDSQRFHPTIDGVHYIAKFIAEAIKSGSATCGWIQDVSVTLDSTNVSGQAFTISCFIDGNSTTISIPDIALTAIGNLSGYFKIGSITKNTNIFTVQRFLPVQLVSDNVYIPAFLFFLNETDLYVWLQNNTTLSNANFHIVANDGLSFNTLTK